MNPPELEFVEIHPASSVVIGWRHDSVLKAEIRSIIAPYVDHTDESSRYFSPERSVVVPPFRIATHAFSWEAFCDWDDETLNSIESLAQFCDRLELDLRNLGCRLPTEDEFEIACGGSLFPWGDEIPQGVPYGNLTEFTAHKGPNEHGLFLNADPYSVEVTRTALKLGDGGESVCGGYDWPIPWLSFCPAHVVPSCLLDDCLLEFLEAARVRPVLNG
jgi:hypothetical protein